MQLRYSYGGYAALAGLTYTPELYCCAVDIVGPAHLRTLLQSVPPYWAPMKKMLTLRVGDVEKDDALNRSVSSQCLGLIRGVCLVSV